MGSMNQAWSKSLSFGSSVFNVYLTCGIGIMLQLDAKDVQGCTKLAASGFDQGTGGGADGLRYRGFGGGDVVVREL